ncbi:phage protein NinX family protein [Pseudomonas putida]|uniref:DUF2591 domain-containing protein n=1 Tax=Pseudomonas putida (strain DOT-T1E) TaxID=1196325 RepID=I7BSR9_PSEPT|nr:phage protein NinX family protein [Pseudomonas putida]AFO47172.1 hypothetical protein T1E_1317 [Pseudomonas putida DOT-T1E]UZM95130.1 DUF2591 domain-containing protein [Pseudomonas putida DOT-T1E]
MTDLIEVKTADLTGEALGWAVGKAEGLDVYLEPPGYNGVPWRVFARYRATVTERTERYNPWEDWALGGKLIEKYQVSLSPPTSAVHRNFGYMDKRNGYYESGLWSSTIFGKERKHRRTAFHHPNNPLIVAMQAIAQFELGDIVQVPKELIPCPA